MKPVCHKAAVTFVEKIKMRHHGTRSLCQVYVGYIMFMHVQLRCILFYIVLTIPHVYVLLYAFVMFPGFI